MSKWEIPSKDTDPGQRCVRPLACTRRTPPTHQIHSNPSEPALGLVSPIVVCKHEGASKADTMSFQGENADTPPAAVLFVPGHRVPISADVLFWQLASEELEGWVFRG